MIRIRLIQLPLPPAIENFHPFLAHPNRSTQIPAKRYGQMQIKGLSNKIQSSDLNNNTQLTHSCPLNHHNHNSTHNLRMALNKPMTIYSLQILVLQVGWMTIATEVKEAWDNYQDLGSLRREILKSFRLWVGMAMKTQSMIKGAV